MTLTTKALIGALLALAVLLGVQTWRVKAAQHDTVEAAVAPAKEAAAAAKVEEQKAGVALAARVDTVKRWLHDTVRVPEHVLHPVTPADTASAVAALPIVQTKLDSTRAACSLLVVTCEQYHASAEQRFAADANVISTQQALLRDRPPRRHWMPCVAGGYGAGLHGGMITTGPTVTVGLCWTPF